MGSQRHNMMLAHDVRCLDPAAADRRRRNSEAAKRSRAKRKQGLEALDKSNQILLDGHAELTEQNSKLREMITSLGGDASLVPPSGSPANEGATSSTQTPNRAKRQRMETRIGDRVTHTAENSSESEDTQIDNNTSQQSEKAKHHQLAVATTALILSLFHAIRSHLSSAQVRPSATIVPQSSEPTQTSLPPKLPRQIQASSQRFQIVPSGNLSLPNSSLRTTGSVNLGDSAVD